MSAFPPAPPRAGHYRVIYADPPWRFATWSARGKGRSPEAWYDCLSVEDICRIPVAAWAAADAVLLLWTTDPMLERAFEVIRAWGFRYKTVGFYWVKLNRRSDPDHIRPHDLFTGLGFWTRANPEPCLLATRGQPRRRATDVARLVVAPPAAPIPRSRMRSMTASSGFWRGPIWNCSPAVGGPAGTPGGWKWGCWIPPARAGAGRRTRRPIGPRRPRRAARAPPGPAAPRRD